MTPWNLSAPPASSMGDHDVLSSGTHLQGKRIALLITGSIAAYRMPEVIREFRRQGAQVIAFVTQEALKYVTKDSLEWTSLNQVVDSFTASAEHLSDATPFDAFLVAPASYNIINKAAHGIADCVVSTTLSSAIGKREQYQTPLLIAPAMHGSMHNSLLIESMQKLASLGAHFIPPRQEHGKNNLPSTEQLLAHTIQACTPQCLEGKHVVITGGPTPVKVDHIRRITTHFTGQLAIEMAKEAWFHGATVDLVLGQGSHTPPDYLPCHWVEDYDAYVHTLDSLFENHTIDIGIFSAAVADYRPETPYEGKLPSSQEKQMLPLVPTAKVIQKLRKQYPDFQMVSFKYEEGISHEALIQIAQKRIQQGSQWVVANRGEEIRECQDHVAWIVGPQKEPERVQGKQPIAHTLIQHLGASC